MLEWEVRELFGQPLSEPLDVARLPTNIIERILVDGYGSDPTGADANAIRERLKLELEIRALGLGMVD